MKDDRFRIGLLLSPIANLAKNLPTDLRERGDSSGQAILTFRFVPLTCHSGRHPGDTPGHTRPRNSQRAKHQPHEFKQFPS
jgi:hypothetical protein